MPSLIDCRFEKLRSLGYTGTTSDMLVPWLIDEGANPLDGNHISDLWRSMLSSKGFTGHINDAWYDYLGSLGHVGSINDREYQFWCSPGIVTSATLSGGGLGTGPEVFFVRTFAGGTDDQIIATTPVDSLDTGDIFSLSTNLEPLYFEDDGRTTALIADGANGVNSRLMRNHFDLTQQLSAICSYKVPTGRTFPGGGTESNPITGSNMKFIWR